MNIFKLVVSISLGWLLFSLPVLADASQACPSTPYILQTPEGYDHLRYAPAERERMYDGGGFVASVDGFDDDNGDGNKEYLVQPTWVAYQLKAYKSPRGSNFAPAYKRPRDWYRISLFDEERKKYQTNKRIDNSYDGVGRIWNRGHLAQRAGVNRLGEEYGCNTHVFANAVPQKASFNQGIWLGLENYVSSLANERGELWVVTGPVFDYGHPLETIGEWDKKEIPVAIPDKMFKVVFMERENGVEVLSFIYPNKYEDLPEQYLSGNCQRDKIYNHTPYLVSLSEIESATGLTFFAHSPIDLSEFKAVRATGLPTLNSENVVGYCL